MSLMTVAVCGAGAMGSGIGQVAAQAGHPVVMFDTAEAALDRGRAGIDKALAGLEAKGRLGEGGAAAVSGRMRWTSDIADLAGAGLVIEAIIEDEAIKAGLFDRIEAVVGEDAILASNTSSLSITRLGAKRRRPDRFAGMHFFNPAPVMKLVEVMAGAETAPEVAAEIARLATGWGKVAIPVRDVPGFIVNRVARPYYAEGFRALGEGVAPAATIDRALKALGGFRMGPLELADLIGHDVNFAVARSVYDAYFGQTRFTPQLAQGALVDAGRLGRKAGRGVYDYGGAAPVEPVVLSAKPARDIRVSGASDPLLLALARDATEADLPDGMIEVDGVLVGLTDGAMAASHARRIGRPVALIDWVGADLPVLIFAASDDDAAAAVAGLAAATGREAYRVADRPGLIALRTLCQLANAAGDAVRDGVADAAGIDDALRHGANYPLGPLAWATGIGHARLIALLETIAAETGEAMYRPSEYFRRAA
ncbi:3-hydroxyacyl-CoA dehydrogenase [Sphingomonas naphthae]|uniref:3-hydroxyacyl-CoA dehydrogenase n=1 Tax=Sphingomonas naphthae TaxID=1813468 RepID=A0ABY7TH27_9SPHN|nr:3-hydroxyacyl-CoA dehydrogenase [Sphingomonas naphthae]WCT72455.1 3-hydroxyacyl-CoA dehydrogenase [Sphingomonas naphthae]